jgi:DNA-binding MarR family transcriptional regulator
MNGAEDPLADALLNLVGFFTYPRRDIRMMREAGLDLLPAYLPLLAELRSGESLSLVALAQRLGRDHSTMSRQLQKLAAWGLIERSTLASDARV